MGKITIVEMGKRNFGVACISARPGQKAQSEMVEGKCARTARHEEQEKACPEKVLRPVAGKYEELNSNYEAEEGQGSEAGEQTEDNQDRAAEFRCGCKNGCDFGRKQRHAILQGEQLKRNRPAGELALRRFREHVEDRRSSGQLHDRQGNALGEAG